MPLLLLLHGPVKFPDNKIPATKIAGFPGAGKNTLMRQGELRNSPAGLSIFYILIRLYSSGKTFPGMKPGRPRCALCFKLMQWERY